MNTTQCPRCGHELPSHVNVCSKCGKIIDIKRKRKEGTARGKGCLVFLGLGLGGLGGALNLLHQYALT